jgi:superfamily II DNA or RNA helicase
MLSSDFLTIMREASSPALWSRAIELSRRDPFVPERVTDEVIAGRMMGLDQKLAFEVELFDADQEWSCTCQDREDPCVHAVAMAIVVKRRTADEWREIIKINAQGDASKSQANQNRNGVITYRFSRLKESLRFERVVVGQGREHALVSSLLTHITTLKADVIAVPNQFDYQVEQSLENDRHGTLRTETMHRLLRALRQAPKVLLDMQPVQTSDEKVGLIVEITDDGAAVALRGMRDPRITEVFANGVALCGRTLHPAVVPEFTQQESDIMRRGGKYFPQEMHRLETSILPALSAKVRVVNKSKRIQIAEHIEPRLRLRIADTGTRLNIEPVIVYADDEDKLFVDRRGMHVVGTAKVARDEIAERRLRDEAFRKTGINWGEIKEVAVSEGLDWIVGTGARHPDLLRTQDLTRYRNSGGLVLTWVNEGGQIGLMSEYNGKKKLFSLSSDDHAGSVSSMLQRAQSAIERGESSIPWLDGTYVSLPIAWLAANRVLIQSVLSARTSDGRALARLVSGATASDGESDNDAESMLAHRSMQWPIVQPFAGFVGALRPYQQHGLNWLSSLFADGVGGILADEMGLGKTVQILACMPKNTLIVAPSSILSNWRSELAKFRPDLKVVIHHGSQRGVLSRDADVVVTSFGLLRQDEKEFSLRTWEMCVIDEAQYVRNPETQSYQSVQSVKAKVKLAVTGTPIENKMTDLWALMNLVNEGLFGSRTSFQKMLGQGVEKGQKSAIAEIRRLVSPFMIRRKKSKVATDLPDRIESVVRIDLNDDERRVYEGLRQEAQTMMRDSSVKAFNMLPALLRLRQSCCHLGLLPNLSERTSTKTDRAIEMIQEITGDGGRVLLFSQWTSFLDLIERRLNETGITHLRVDGGTANRGEIVSQFQNGEGDVMLLSLKAAGVGLNLTAADHVFIMDPWWNPAVEAQAADRAHRIGQTKNVMIHRFVAEGTVEERVLALQEHKQRLVEALDETQGEADSLDIMRDLLEV